jgi:hypothetical protein
MATVNALTAKLNNQDVSLEDLIGKQPGERESVGEQIESESPEVIQEWKTAADTMGLKLP